MKNSKPTPNDDFNPTEKDKLMESAKVAKANEDISLTGLIQSGRLSSMNFIRNELIEKISTGDFRSLMLAEVEVLGTQLDFNNAPPLERLLIDHILTVRLRLLHAEALYNKCMGNQSITLKQGDYRERQLTQSQTRFLRAIENLARVRRLSRNTPSLQINIAQQGGKQVNVVGEVNS
jgi:hypothetical protein